MLKKKISNSKLKNKELYQPEKENLQQQAEKQRTLSTWKRKTLSTCHRTLYQLKRRKTLSPPSSTSQGWNKNSIWHKNAVNYLYIFWIYRELDIFFVDSCLTTRWHPQDKDCTRRSQSNVANLGSMYKLPLWCTGTRMTRWPHIDW